MARLLHLSLPLAHVRLRQQRACRDALTVLHIDTHQHLSRFRTEQLRTTYGRQLSITQNLLHERLAAKHRRIYLHHGLLLLRYRSRNALLLIIGTEDGIAQPTDTGKCHDGNCARQSCLNRFPVHSNYHFEINMLFLLAKRHVFICFHNVNS